MSVRLFAFVRRREGLSREEFLAHWHEAHGPLIRDTAGLGDRMLRYEQHPARPGDRSGWDGVAVQEYASWDDFTSMLADPAAERMREDEARFLDPSSITVVFTEGRVQVIGGGHGGAHGGGSTDEGGHGASDGDRRGSRS